MSEQKPIFDWATLTEEQQEALHLLVVKMMQGKHISLQLEFEDCAALQIILQDLQEKYKSVNTPGHPAVIARRILRQLNNTLQDALAANLQGGIEEYKKQIEAKNAAAANKE